MTFLSQPRDMMVDMIGHLRSVVFDCPDPLALAEFYSQVTGLDRHRTEETWVVLADDESGVRIAFQKADNYQPPRWPDPAHPQQIHLDLLVGDIDTAEAQVLAIGATRLPGEGDDFRVYADPAGHPFCLMWES